MKKAIQWSTWLRINVEGVHKEQQSTRLQINWMWSRFIHHALRRRLSEAEGCHSSPYHGEKDSLSLIEAVPSSRAKTFIIFLLITAYSCNCWQCFMVHAHLPSEYCQILWCLEREPPSGLPVQFLYLHLWYYLWLQSYKCEVPETFPTNETASELLTLCFQSFIQGRPGHAT